MTADQIRDAVASKSGYRNRVLLEIVLVLLSCACRGATARRTETTHGTACTSAACAAKEPAPTGPIAASGEQPR